MKCFTMSPSGIVKAGFTIVSPAKSMHHKVGENQRIEMGIGPNGQLASLCGIDPVSVNGAIYNADVYIRAFTFEPPVLLPAPNDQNETRLVILTFNYPQKPNFHIFGYSGAEWYYYTGPDNGQCSILASFTPGSSINALDRGQSAIQAEWNLENDQLQYTYKRF